MVELGTAFIALFLVICTTAFFLWLHKLGEKGRVSGKARKVRRYRARP